MRLAIPALALALLAGCAVEPAPEDLDGLARWLFKHYPDASDAELADAFTTTLAAVGELADPRTGSLEPLTDEDVAHTARDEAQELAEAQGFFLAMDLDCDLERVEEIITTRDQDALYESYDEYERTYTSDRDAYFARAAPTLTWDIDLSATPITAQYHAQFKGGVRHVDDTARGVLQFTWMPSPASFDDTQGNAYEQDYQIEAYLPRDGRVVHFWAMWRDMRFGSFSAEDDIFLTTLVEGLIDWDRRTEELCAESG